MKKTPSYLKGIAETRARLAGDIERYERLLSESRRNRSGQQVEWRCGVRIRFEAQVLKPPLLKLLRPAHRNVVF